MIAHQGTVWRILNADAANRAAECVASPEGRFHHDGQAAIYTSLTPEGCGVAIRRYLLPDGPPRVIVPLVIAATALADLREAGPAPSVVWQDLRAAGQDAPTWALSDTARDGGAQGLLYRSRSRPDLHHLVIFDPAVITTIGPPQPWNAP